MVNNYLKQATEYQLDALFHCLADPTRRDIVGRVAAQELSVGQLADDYQMSLPAISKHLKVLEQSRLINRRKEGRSFFISINLPAMRVVDTYLERYRQMWESRFNKLELLLQEELSSGQN